jgi:hypothetical protein
MRSALDPVARVEDRQEETGDDADLRGLRVASRASIVVAPLTVHWSVRPAAPFFICDSSNCRLAPSAEPAIESGPSPGDVVDGEVHRVQDTLEV